jgi:predicted nuclease of predicted toxin-antitoxin system
MRFLVDQCVDVAVNDWLRKAGFDTVHLREQQLQRLPNGGIFDKAYAEERVIVTLDLDFGEIVSLSHGAAVSVVVFRVHDTRGVHLVSRLESVLLHVTTLLEHGAIVVVEEARYRVRHLPIR